ncbi:YciI family protein [Tropicimonas sp. IMCC6043]|uniref:YciI family protein n=1 Tax=Tropicimonas sp. IMCC6043 TaxID=2510645 RepID=UPI00101DF7DB|nr:YciI family protein [Tropicimonas sp. IMCC6043]RYH09986.1 YciI family protein [Tropicimonas sp. IMCC6043]
MLVALIARDRAGALQTRLDNRDAHIAHLKGSDMVVEAGPLLDAKGDMCGSLVIFEADTVAQVEAWAAEDPYGKAGLFESVEIIPWKKVIG